MKLNDTYQGSLNVSFHRPCLAQWAYILSSRMITSENVGLTAGWESQHSSINLHSKEYEFRIVHLQLKIVKE